MSRDAATRSVPAAALRRLLLARSGLLRWNGAHKKRGPHAEGAPWREELQGEEGVLQAIHRLEAVQLDPVAVVDRNHHLVLRNRVGSYRSDHLEALYRRKLVFEYEANARCVLPIEDYPIFEPVRLRLRSLQPPFSPQLQAAVGHVRDRLAAEGPLPARSLESGDRVKGYWDAAPRTKATSQALEYLWEAGEVVVALRKGDERHFALAETWLGLEGGADSWEPLLHKYLQAYGVADPSDSRFGWRKWPVAERRAACERLVKEGMLERVQVEGARRPYYVLADSIPLLEALGRATVVPEVYLLPPLDNVLWRRDRVSDLFGFDYTWEIYTPAVRRRFGPYAMPILEGERFIGRLDARLDRTGRVLQVECVSFEPDVEPSATRTEGVWAAIEALAEGIGVDRVAMTTAMP